MKICPKCNGINDNKARFCRFCGNDFYQELTIQCPNCGRLCSLDKERCPNCGAKLPIRKRKRPSTFYPKSWLGSRRLLIKLGILLVAVISIFCIGASLKSSTYLYHASASRKIQINYQNSKHKVIFSEYYDVRPMNSNYANFFGGKESFWQKNRSFKSSAYYYGKDHHGYDKLWKENNGKPLAKYLMIQRVRTNQNQIEIRQQGQEKPVRLISDQNDPMKFMDQYRDRGKCIFPNDPAVRYYQLNTLTQY